MARECLRREKEWRGKGEATRGSEGLNKSELECRGGLEEQKNCGSFLLEGLQVLAPKIIRGRVLVLIARSLRFDVYQPLAVAGISSEILDES
jgi:hypothetical protein